MVKHPDGRGYLHTVACGVLAGDICLRFTRNEYKTYHGIISFIFLLFFSLPFLSTLSLNRHIEMQQARNFNIHTSAIHAH